MTHPIRRTSAVCLQICFHHFSVAFWRRLEVKGAQSQSNDVEVLLKLPVRGQRLKLVGNNGGILAYMGMIRIMLHSQKSSQKNHPKSIPKNHPINIWGMSSWDTSQAAGLAALFVSLLGVALQKWDHCPLPYFIEGRPQQNWDTVWYSAVSLICAT